MKRIKPAVLPFFLFLAGLILTALLIMNRDLRTRTACAVTGRGMLSLVQQTMEEPPRVALTFDDGPNSKYTPMLLEGLRKRNILATFFLVGENIEGNEEILLEMQKDGHLIGNHTWDHVQLDKISREKPFRKSRKPTTASTKSLAFIHPISALPSVPGRKIWNCPSPCCLYSGISIPWTGKAAAQTASCPLSVPRFMTVPSS